MTKIRNVLIGLLVSVVVSGVASCGGGGGYGDSATPTYTVGGTISGSAGTVVLQLNGGGNLSMPAPGSFTFTGALVSGTTYNVTLIAANQTCTVTNGAGTVSGANITNVTIACTAQTTQIVIRSASLSGAQEVPPVTTAGTGRGAVVVDPTDPMNIRITGGITFTGLTGAPTGAHIHRGDGTPFISLSADNASASVPAGTTLSSADYAELLAGTLYFNVHTAMNVNGEIRSQINVQGGVITGLATLNGAQEVPPNVSTATGRGTLVIDSATREVLIAYLTHNVAGANAAHIHTGTSGYVGGVRVGLNLGTSVATAPQGATLTAQDLADLALNYLYFNVHSPTYPDGEIRGQIAVQ